jgi:catechol 2,3-dioxygenase-like lactoylglutathione lyase family enzyme
MKTEFFGVAPLLQVYDMPTAVRFYRDLLGFELVNQSRDGEEFDWCLMSRSGAEVMLKMYESEHRPSQPDAKRTAAHADMGLYFACCELYSAYEHLRANGIRMELRSWGDSVDYGVSDHHRTAYVYCSGPNHGQTF